MRGQWQPVNADAAAVDAALDTSFDTDTAGPVADATSDVDREYALIQNGTGMFTKKRCCGCLTPVKILWIFNLLALLGHLAIAIVVLVEGLPNSDKLEFQMTMLVARWHNRSADGFTYTVEPSPFGKLNLVWLCAIFSLLSATSHLLVVASTSFEGPLARFYYRSLYNCQVPWRWAEYSLSAPIMTLSLLVISGMRDQSLLLLCFFAQLATMPCGFATELNATPRRDKEGKEVLVDPSDKLKSPWNRGWEQPLSKRLVPFWIGVVVHAPTWIVFLLQFFMSVDRIEARNENVRVPDFVYSIVIGQVVLFTSFTFPLVVYQCLPPKYYWHTELIYTILSFTAKTLLNGQMLANVILIGRLDYS